MWSLLEFKSLAVSFVELKRIYGTSAMQAVTSALLTVVLGLWGALGVFWVRAKMPPALIAGFEFFILLPSLLPGLFIIVSFLNLIPNFPFGFWGVVVLHAASHVGLAALILHRLLESKLSPFFELAVVTGSGRFYFFKKSFPLLLEQIAHIILVFFVLFITSVSIPLVMAGGGATSLESAIYQQILSFHDWNKAINLFIVQFAAIALLFSLVPPRSPLPSETYHRSTVRFFASSFGVLPAAIPTLIVLTSLLAKIPEGLLGIEQQPSVLEDGLLYTAGSLLTGLLVGGLSFLLLTVFTYLYQTGRHRKVAVFLITPSFVILAFSFSLFAGQGPWLYGKIALALTVGFFPSLLRLGYLQKIASYDETLDEISLLGGRSSHTFFKGIWPQLLPQISLLSGLAAVWAMGDFAVSRVIAGRDITLAMWVQSLVDQYRWDIALVLSWLILGTSLLIFGFFWSLSYVSYKKLS